MIAGVYSKKILSAFYVSVFLLISGCVLTGALSCAALKPLVKPRSPQKEYGEKAVKGISFEDFLTRRVWFLAGCKTADGFAEVDPNAGINFRIKFSPENSFEAGSGISVYTGAWKKTKKISENTYGFNMKTVTAKKSMENEAQAEKFDKSFSKAVENCAAIEIDIYSIRLYDKTGELILHFIRM